MKKDIIIGVLLVFNISLCIFTLMNRDIKINAQVQHSREDNHLFNDFCVEEFIKSFSYSITNQGRFFQITDSIRDQLYELFSKGSERKLFFRMDFPYCGNCIFPVIEMLSKNTIINTEEIIILAAFPSERHIDDEFLHFIHDKNLKVINIPDFDMCFEMTGLIEPYFFIMDSSLFPDKLFFVNQCNGFLLKTYLNLIQHLIV